MQSIYKDFSANSKLFTSPMEQMLKQFNEFAQNFHGDPQAEVMKLLQSGQVSQAQLDEVQHLAGTLMQYIR